MIRSLCALCLSLASPLPALADVSPAAKVGIPQLLRNFALAQCVRLAFDDPAVQADAAAAAGAYVELGSSGPEAYDAIVALAQKYLARIYTSHSGSKLQLMKCLDLQNSPELAAIIARSARRKH